MRFHFATDRRGAAAVEFALWLAFLIVPTLNAIDLGFYAFQAIQVREAAQSAAQAAEALCSPQTFVPAAAPNCTSANTPPGLSTALTNAAQSTSLGSTVTVSTSATKSFEGWYCSNTTGGLTLVGSTWPLTATSAPGPPACSGTVSKNIDTAGDYITVNVTYTFHPLFAGASVASLLSSTISQSASMRLA